MDEAVRRRLPESVAAAISNQLRAPAYLALRKPFFFTRYFEKNRDLFNKTAEVPAADVDELLDWSEAAAIEKAADDLNLSENDLTSALMKLVETLWQKRSIGLTYSEALNVLESEIGGRAGELINVWRKSGFLTVEGNINFAELLGADRIFAKFVERRVTETNFGFLSELDPRKDFGTVTAYLRQSSEPTAAAERLIKINSEWMSAVVTGFAQTSGDDWRVLAMLSGLLAEHQFSNLSGAIYNALGQLAARSKRAYKWVAEMYLGERARTWHRGAYAFVSTVEYEPRRVEKAVRARLSRLIKINHDFFDRDKRKKWIVNNALVPFRGINHLSAARVGQRIINRYQFLTGSDEEENTSRDWDFIEEMDEIRGRIGVFDAGEFTQLLDDLESSNPVLRYWAVQALIKSAIEKPETVKEAICQRLELEDKARTLQQLLIAAYHLIEKFPGELLTALSRSRVSKFTEGFRFTDGLTFELSGNLAEKSAMEVANLLPLSLEPRDSVEKALVGEMFVYAWWRACEFSDHSINYAPFELFDRFNYSVLEPDFRPFAIRSRPVSLLARMCLDLNISTAELTGRQSFYPKLNKDFLFIDFGDFLGKHLARIYDHELFEEFKQILLECIRQSDPVNLYPLSRMRNAVFTCGSGCLELLTDIAAAMLEPVPLLDALPHGWQAIRATADLLKMGKTDALIVAFAEQVLSEQKGSSTTQADAESRELRAQLGLLESDHEQSLREQREASMRLSIFADASNAHGIAVFTAKNPDKFLEYLEASILNIDDVLTLYALADKARNWQAVLISRIYARMISERPIRLCEAGNICEQMLAAAGSMSPSSVKDQYEIVYQSISRLLNGQRIGSPIALNFDHNSGNIIGYSHRLAAEILNHLIKTPEGEKTEQWLEELLYSRRWWEETDRFIFKDSLLIQGVGQYAIYFFPAVRLALIAATLKRQKTVDPAIRIMRERFETHKLLSDHKWLFDRNDLSRYENDVLNAFEDFDKAALRTPGDERVENARGDLLLHLNKLHEAEEAFNKSLALPTSVGHFRAMTLYKSGMRLCPTKSPR